MAKLRALVAAQVGPSWMEWFAMPYTLADGTTILVMGLSDLIQAKKTQRLKDWGAIEMLLAASIASSPAQYLRITPTTIP